jgi:hypothetical protein
MAELDEGGRPKNRYQEQLRTVFKNQITQHPKVDDSDGIFKFQVLPKGF